MEEPLPTRLRTSDDVLVLQRKIGNRAVSRLIQRQANFLDDDEETFLKKRKTVRKGNQGGEVAKAQILMDSVLFGGPAPPEYHGVDDLGDFTPRFDALVRLFQARTKQTIDGVIGRRTWDMIFLLSGSPEDEEEFLRQRKTIRKSDQGGEVAKAQVMIDGILSSGAAPPEYHALEDIGDFTLRFDALVRLFQARTKQDIDGVVGRKTWDMLFLFASLGRDPKVTAQAEDA